MPHWKIYMVRCADNTLYTGISTNVEKRLAAHNAGRGARYTRARRPVTLVWQSTQTYLDLGQALKEERRIKSLRRCDKEWLVYTVPNEV